MESPEDIEKALAALVPSALSARGQRSLDELIDSLAAGESPLAELPEPEATPAPELAPARRRPWGAWAAATGAAAAAVVFAFQMPGQHSAQGAAQVVVTPPAAVTTPEVESLGQDEFVDSAVPENWMSVKDGVPHRAMRVRYVTEERLRDNKTGYEMVVSQAHEDVDWSPIDRF